MIRAVEIDRRSCTWSVVGSRANRGRRLRSRPSSSARLCTGTGRPPMSVCAPCTRRDNSRSTRKKTGWSSDVHSQQGCGVGSAVQLSYGHMRAKGMCAVCTVAGCNDTTQ